LGENPGRETRWVKNASEGHEALKALTGLVIHGAVRRPEAHALCERRRWLTFWLTDGIILGHSYCVETRELMGGGILAGELTRILDRYLNE
jgi:hypothetical protein